jgi:hypothetical protein
LASILCFVVVTHFAAGLLVLFSLNVAIAIRLILPRAPAAGEAASR